MKELQPLKRLTDVSEHLERCKLLFDADYRNRTLRVDSPEIKITIQDMQQYER